MKQLFNSIIWICLVYTLTTENCSAAEGLKPKPLGNDAQPQQPFPNGPINQKVLPQVATTNSPFKTQQLGSSPEGRSLNPNLDESAQTKGDFIIKQVVKTNPVILSSKRNLNLADGDAEKSSTPKAAAEPAVDQPSEKHDSAIENRRLVITHPVENTRRVDSYAVQLAVGSQGEYPEQTEDRMVMPWFSAICRNQGPRNFFEYISNIGHKAKDLFYAIFPKLDPNCQVAGGFGLSDILKRLALLLIPFLGILKSLLGGVPSLFSKFFGGSHSILFKIVKGLLSILNPLKWLLFPIKLGLQLINKLFFGGKYCILGLCDKSFGNGPWGLILKMLLKTLGFLNPLKWLGLIPKLIFKVIKGFSKLLTFPIRLISRLITSPFKLISLLFNLVSLPFKLVSLPFKLLFFPLRLLRVVVWPIRRIIKLLKDMPNMPLMLGRIIFWPIRTTLAPFRWLKGLIFLPLTVLFWPFKIFFNGVKKLFKIITWPIRLILSPFRWVKNLLFFPIRLPFLLMKKLFKFIYQLLHNQKNKSFGWIEKVPFKLVRFFLRILFYPLRLLQKLLWPIRLIMTPIKWLMKILFHLVRLGFKLFFKFLRSPFRWSGGVIKFFKSIFKLLLKKVFPFFFKLFFNFFKKSLSIFNPFNWIKKIFANFGPFKWIKNIFSNLSPFNWIKNIFSHLNPLNWIKKILGFILSKFLNKNPTDIACLLNPSGCVHDWKWFVNQLYACFVTAFKQFLNVGKPFGFGFMNGILNIIRDVKGIIFPNPPRSIGPPNPPNNSLMLEFQEPIIEAPPPSFKMVPAPQEVIQVPQEIIQVPQEIIQVPQQVMQVPQQMMQVPKQIVEVPQQMMQVPQQMMQVPQQMMQEHQQIIQVPQQVAPAAVQYFDIRKSMAPKKKISSPLPKHDTTAYVRKSVMPNKTRNLGNF